MRLLVSVRNAVEASAALAGGADLIDAKDPSAGALGAVSVEMLHDIAGTVGRERPVSAAIGDAVEAAAVEHAACAYAAAGAALVKLGFAGIAGPMRVATLTAAAVRGAKSGSDGKSGVVAVAYADADAAENLAPGVLVEVAARAGARGVLLDTADKRGPGLRELMAPSALAAWVAEAHEAGLFAAVAGKLTAADLVYVRDAGADIAGVRGAACDGGRSGRVTADRVRVLRTQCGRPDVVAYGGAHSGSQVARKGARI